MDKNKIILLNLPPDVNFHYPDRGSIYPATAIMLIGSLLHQHGFNVQIIDGAYYENYHDLLLNYLTEEEGVIYVGMSVMTTQIPFALQTSKLIREHNSNIPIVWGGPHPTLFPQETLKNKYVDIVVINEGAFTGLDLAFCLKNNLSLGNVKGIGFKDSNNGDRIIINNPAGLEDINKLPHLNFSLIDINNYLFQESDSVYQREFPQFKEKIKIVPILTGLGCPYKCNFCINVILKRRYRFRSAASIIEEIEYLQDKYGANTFLFLDEDFFINKKRTLDFLSLVEKKNLRFNWRMWCRVDHFQENYINAEMLQRLENIGHGSMVMGGESANSEVLDYLNKGITPEQIENSLRYLAKTKIFARYSFMVGLEDETLEQIKNTYNFCIKLKGINPRADIVIFTFRLYPGSPIYTNLISKYNITMPDSLESWVEHLHREDCFTRLTWTPPYFQKNYNLLNFYSHYAVSSITGNGLKYLLKRIMKLLAQFRIKYFCLSLPVEFWLHKTYKGRLFGTS